MRLLQSSAAADGSEWISRDLCNLFEAGVFSGGFVGNAVHQRARERAANASECSKAGSRVFKSFSLSPKIRFVYAAIYGCIMVSSLVDLRAFPIPARREAGHQIDQVQQRREPDDWKPMPRVGSGVQEIRIRDAAGAFRVIFVAKFAAAITRTIATRLRCGFSLCACAREGCCAVWQATVTLLCVGRVRACRSRKIQPPL
jgi:hypothetical protein